MKVKGEQVRTEKSITTHVIEYEGKFWGIQYEDGHSTSYGYGPIGNAQHVNPQFCKKPEHATYKGSPYIKDLRKGTIRSVRITTIVEY